MTTHAHTLLLPANGRHSNLVIGAPACTKLLAKYAVERKSIIYVLDCALFVILANVQVTAAALNRIRANSKRLTDNK